MSSWSEQLRQAEAEVDRRNADPLRCLVEPAVRGFETIGTAPCSTCSACRRPPVMPAALARPCARWGSCP
jgi:hypothetical protein